jgi:hypothetical protein
MASGAECWEGEVKTGCTIAVETYDEITTFLNSPARMSQNARE